MLNDTQALFVPAVVVLCLKKGNESPLDRRVVQIKTTLHTRQSHDRLNIE
jgi:hypothetical protein